MSDEASQRPPLPPAVLAALVEAAPARLVRKLDKAPRMADAWSWEAEEGGRVTVQTASEETVQLSPPLTQVEALSCTCLLAPRCLHVLAVARALPLGDAAAPEAGPSEHGESEGAAPNGAAPERAASESPDVPAAAEGAIQRDALSPRQLECARRAFVVGARFLDGGANAAGAAGEAALLRLVHDARGLGLHRVASAALRVVRGVRLLAEEAAHFTLEGLVEATRELLNASFALGSGVYDERLVGTARRRYREVGSLRLRGVFTEPVLSSAGYAGAVTWMVDADGRLYSVPGVLPGGASRAMAAYEEPASVGDVSLAHRELSRAGLFMQRATSSADGRLGAGKAVQAVRAGASSWNDEAIAERFTTPLAEQLDGAYAQIAQPTPTGGAGLLFVEAIVSGVSGDALALATAGGEMFASAPIEHEALAFRPSMRRLARAPGLGLRAIARLDPRRPRHAHLLAVGPPAEDPERTWRVPDAWAGRVDVGYQRLVGAHLTIDRRPAARDDVERSPDPLEASRRRVQRVVLGGRGSMPSASLPEVAREAALLERRMMPTLAAATRALAVISSERSRNIDGARGEGDSEGLARVWLAAAEAERVARTSLARAEWDR